MYTHTHMSTYTHVHTCTYSCTHTHMHTDTCTQKHMYTDIHTHAHICICIHSCTYTHMHTDTHVDMHTLMHTYTHVYIHAHRHTGAHIHMHTDIHAYIYTHAHTHLHTYSSYSCTHTHVHIHAHTLMYTYTHMHTYAHVHRHIHTVWQLLHFQFSMRDRGRQEARSESLVLQLPWALPLKSLYHRRTEASLGSCLSSPPCFSGPCPITAHRRCSKARLSLCPSAWTTSPTASLSQAGLQMAHLLILPLTLLFPQQRDTPQTSVPTAGKPPHL